MSDFRRRIRRKLSLQAECKGWLSEFRRIFAGDVIDLVVSEPVWRNAGRDASFAEEAIQTGRRRHSEEEQFVIGLRKSMPGVLVMNIVHD